MNARRVSQIVESVLQLSRRERRDPERLQLPPWLEDFAREFVQTLELYEGAVAVRTRRRRSRCGWTRRTCTRSLWNLCENAREVRERGGRRDRRRARAAACSRRPAARSSRSPIAARASTPQQRRADLRAVLHGPARRHGSRPVHFARALPRRNGADAALRAARRRRQRVPHRLRRSAALAVAATRPVSKPDRTGRRRRTRHPRAAVDHARAHGHLDARRAADLASAQQAAGRRTLRPVPHRHAPARRRRARARRVDPARSARARRWR